jgi:uncharacterized membrane protein
MNAALPSPQEANMATQAYPTYNGRAVTVPRSHLEQQLANGLGWFSIGLGVAEVIAPGAVAQLIGVRDKDKTRAVLRTYGLREIASGVGILTQRRPSGWVWSRVAGDMLDLASLGNAYNSRGTNTKRVAVATTALLGITALDVLCGQQLSAEPQETVDNDTVRVRKTIVINKSPEEVYAFWRNLQNLSTFMEGLESVRELDGGKSHWKVRTPAGKTIEWDAQMVDDHPGKSIAWHSLEGADIPNSGVVRFERAPGGRGTVVSVELEYTPPAGILSAAVAKLFGTEPGQLVDENLRRFKQVIETGEVMKSDASIFPGMHAAQPPASIPASKGGNA